LRYNRLVVVAALSAAALALALPSRAHAFADATQFFNQSAAPHAATFGASGEGLYFTGAPRFASLDCLSCHQGGPQQVGLRLNADDMSLFTSGYVPGHTYTLQVQLTNESEGLKYNTKNCTDPPAPDDKYQYVQCNNNGYALEIDTAEGPLAGPSVYCAQKPGTTGCPMPDYTADESLVAPDGDAVFGSKIYSTDPNNPKLIINNDATSWRFWWTAPKAGTGPLTVYVAGVDGNGGNGTVANDQDPYGDDTVSANFFLQESNAGVDNAAHAGCSVGGAGAAAAGSPAAWWCLVALLFGRGLARRRALAFLRCPPNALPSSSNIAPR
jgi:hypothetical protein